MAEQFLYIPYPGAVVQKLGGEAVSEKMRRGSGIDAGAVSVFIENVFHAVDAQAGAFPADKKRRIPWIEQRPDAEPGVDLMPDGRSGDEEEAFFSAFSVYEYRVVIFAVIFHIKSADLADAQSEAVEQLDDAHVPQGKVSEIFGRTLLIVLAD